MSAHPTSGSAPAPPIAALSDTVAGLATGGVPAWRSLLDGALHLGFNLLLAAAILAATLWAARWASRLARGATARLHREHGPDLVLQNFIGSLVRYAVMVIGVVAMLQQLGVRTTSVIAVLGAASLAIGLALQGGLTNVAAGVMILILRPFRVGDRVEIVGHTGIVRALDLFVTRLTDCDGRLVIIPNGKAFGEVIVNHTGPALVSFTVDCGIDYGDDVDKALDVLLACARAEKRIAADPPPWAKLTALNDSAVVVTLRAWTAAADVLQNRYDMLKSVKTAFDAAGLTFAYPHQVSIDASAAALAAAPAAAANRPSASNGAFKPA